MSCCREQQPQELPGTWQRLRAGQAGCQRARKARLPRKGGSGQAGAQARCPAQNWLPDTLQVSKSWHLWQVLPCPDPLGVLWGTARGSGMFLSRARGSAALTEGLAARKSWENYKLKCFEWSGNSNSTAPRAPGLKLPQMMMIIIIII